jgi:large subunit ribosomal protein L29
MTKASELRELSSQELQAKVLELRHELFNIQFEIDSTKNPAKAHMRPLIRKKIARALTVLREKEIEQLANQLS